MKTFQTSEFHCPECEYKGDRASGLINDQPPRPGDLTICLNCGILLSFRVNFTLRKICAAEIRELMNERKTWAIIQRAQFLIQKRGRLHEKPARA